MLRFTLSLRPMTVLTHGLDITRGIGAAACERDNVITDGGDLRVAETTVRFLGEEALSELLQARAADPGGVLIPAQRTIRCVVGAIPTPLDDQRTARLATVASEGTRHAAEHTPLYGLEPAPRFGYTRNRC